MAGGATRARQKSEQAQDLTLQRNWRDLASLLEAELEFGPEKSNRRRLSKYYPRCKVSLLVFATNREASFRN